MSASEGEDEEFAVAVDADLAGGRLDAVLARALPAFSRNRIKDLILAGAAAINGQTAAEPKTSNNTTVHRIGTTRLAAGRTRPVARASGVGHQEDRGTHSLEGR